METGIESTLSNRGWRGPWNQISLWRSVGLDGHCVENFFAGSERHLDIPFAIVGAQQFNPARRVLHHEGIGIADYLCSRYRAGLNASDSIVLAFVDRHR